MSAQTPAVPVMSAPTTSTRSRMRKGAVTPSVAVWNPLLSAIRATVAECNMVAGEPLWTIIHSDANPARLVVCSTGDAARCLELSLRPGSATLRCIYGCDSGGATRELEAVSETIRIGEQRLNVAQAADTLLDALVAGLE